MVWIARDAEDNVALFFDTSSDGGVPVQAIDHPDLELLEGIADLPWRAAPIYDREAFTRPDALHHVPYWERDTGPLLMFVDDEAAAREVQRRFDARVLPATTGVVLEVGRVSAPGFRAIHRALCRGCFYPPRVFGADRGFFVYEHATPGVPGPYVRRQFPRRPIKRSSLDVIADFDAGDVEFDDLRFADLPELQPVEDCDCRSPGIFFSLRTRAFAERDRRLGASAEDHRRCARRVPGLAGGIRLDRDVNVDSDTDPGVPQRVWLTLADAAEAGPTWDLSWPEPEALEVQFGLDDARARAGLEIARSSRPRPAPAPARPQRRGRARAMTPLAPRNRCARATSRRARCHSERPMDGATMEARVVTTNNVLIRLSEVEDASPLDDFCGTSFNLTPQSSWRPSLANKTVYLCGDIAEAASLEPELRAAARVFVVRERSRFDADRVPWPVVGVGRVPVLVHGAGVLYRRFFEDDRDLFHDIRAEHSFQSLTQSNKPGTAHRTGLYLTPVERDGDALRFRLLRCSTNLSGPTANFGPSDRRVVDALNEEARAIFADQARLNHVLAQIYWNTPATERKKQTKAKINGHADKTKDMPANGIMAFCTFYDQLDGLQPLADDPFDRGYKRASALTKLQFRLKKVVATRPGCAWKRQFDVTLYPNSVFFMPLSTNRLYTHEIRPAGLDVERLPTRMGYVVRCSTREAVHRGGRTYLDLQGALVELEPPTREGLAELRRLYAEENRSDERVDYGDGFRFSMNQGDYARPEVE